MSSNRIITQPIWQTTLNFLKVSEVRFWEKDLWPSNLPDLNPLDYYFYAQIEAKAFESSRNSITALNEDIKKAVRSLEMAEITHGVSMFCTPLENLILAKGGQIVWKICPICILNKLTKFDNYIFNISWDIKIFANKKKLSGFTC